MAWCLALQQPTVWLSGWFVVELCVPRKYCQSALDELSCWSGSVSSNITSNSQDIALLDKYTWAQTGNESICRYPTGAFERNRNSIEWSHLQLLLCCENTAWPLNAVASGAVDEHALRWPCGKRSRGYCCERVSGCSFDVLCKELCTYDGLVVMLSFQI
jgi:hypothetical protein